LSYSEFHLRFRSGLLREERAVGLSVDPLPWVSCASSFASSYGRRNVNASWPTPIFACGLLTSLSCFLPWLRSLHSSLLSQGVNATMNRSDPSLPHSLLLSPSESSSQKRSRRFWEQTRSPSVTHVSVPIIPTPTTSRGLPCAGLRHFPGRLVHPCPPNRVHFRFGLIFWLGPFTAFLAEGSCLCLLGVFRLHRSPRRDLNPLDTCAARRTKVRLRGLGR